MFLRIVLIALVLYLVLRTLKALLRSPRRVDGEPPKAPRKIDESRVQDANFKDLPDE